MFDTEELAAKEGKIPVVALQDPEDEKNRKYLLIEMGNLKKIVREIDCHLLDQRIPSGTTIHKLLMSTNSESMDLLTIREKIQIQIKQIMRDKVITNDRLERIQALSTMIYFIDTIMDYLKDVANEQSK